MSTFFDLREFLITFLKKFRLNFLIVILCTMCGFFVRFVPLMIEYISYDEFVNSQITDNMDDYPYLYEARRTIYIDPMYKVVNDEFIDESKNVISTFLACYQNKEILEPLAEKYYQEAAILYNKNQESQVKYQFITSAAKRDFMLQDFYTLIKIRETNQRLISITAKTGSPEFSEKLVSSATELLNEYVKYIVGEYDYTITEGQIGISLPADTTGVVIKPNTKTINQKNSISFIITRSIKGAVWGLAGGIVISLLICFFFYSVSQQIFEENDLLEFKIPILASLTDKNSKSKEGVQGRIIAYLRGNTVQFDNYEECGRVVRELMKQKISGVQPTIVLTGSCDFSFIEKMANALNQTDLTVVPVNNIVYSAESLKKAEDLKDILLIEKLNESSKVEIAREIHCANYLGKKVLGFIIIR